MKYTQGFKKKKNIAGTAFVSIIACCLLIIGGAAWFALSNYNKEDTTPDIKNKNEYSSNEFSYTESEPQVEDKTESVNESVNDEPYVSSANKTEKEIKLNVFSMPVEGEIIKNFSSTELQYSETYGDMRLHTGIDIACENGTKVSACANGTVQLLEQSGQYGNVVTINHGDGIVIKYSALDKVNVEIGDKINAGDIIGVATTVPSECSEKSHIHIEVFKNEKAVSLTEIINIE